MDSTRRANIIHYGSIKSKRVTRSAFSAELYAMIHGFDNASVLIPILRRIVSPSITLKIYTDSKSLYDSCTRLTMTFEKRLISLYSVKRTNIVTYRKLFGFRGIRIPRTLSLS